MSTCTDRQTQTHNHTHSACTHTCMQAGTQTQPYSTLLYGNQPQPALWGCPYRVQQSDPSLWGCPHRLQQSDPSLWGCLHRVQQSDPALWGCPYRVQQLDPVLTGLLGRGVGLYVCGCQLSPLLLPLPPHHCTHLQAGIQMQVLALRV